MNAKQLSLLLVLATPALAGANEPPALLSESIDRAIDTSRLERKARALKISGAISMGLGFVVQGVGVAFLLVPTGDESDHPPASKFYTGLSLTTIGSAAVTAGAIMHGFGAAYGRTARKLRAANFVPSIAPLASADRHGIGGAAASVSIQF